MNRRIPFHIYHHPVGDFDGLPDNRTFAIMIFSVIVLGFFYVDPEHTPTRLGETIGFIVLGYALELTRQDFTKEYASYKQLIAEMDTD